MKQSLRFAVLGHTSAYAKTMMCLVLGSAIWATPAWAVNETNPTNSVVVATQQQGKVTIGGKVTDAKTGQPIVGATVIEKGTTNGAVTDIDGMYSVKVAPGATLVVSCLGYLTQEVNGGNVSLQEESTELNELVVIGYGTQRKGDVTSAVASVKAEDFTVGKIGDAAELIKGKVAGLSVTNSSGNPTASSSIMLRGATTISGSVTPLILVDGVEGDLNTVAPENIASIDVLKDASAAAIYGTRGANGVILITTKTGRRDSAPAINYSAYVSFSKWADKADFMDTHDVIYGKTAYSYEGYDTDWLDAISREAGSKQNHALSISGGSKNAVYAANFAYSDENGILQNSDNENLKLQLDYTQYAWNDILKFNFNTLVTRQKYSLNNADYAYRQAVIRNPSSPIYNEDGSYNENFDKLQYYNPVEVLNEYYGDTRVKYYQLTGGLSVTPIKGWETSIKLTLNESTGTSESFTTKEFYSLAKETNYNGYASKSEGNSQTKEMEITSRYSNTFKDDHRFEALIGYSYLENNYDGFNAGNGNFSTDYFEWNNLGNGTLLTEEDRHASMGSYRNGNKLIGFFGRVSYGYADKYNVLASIRREGSTKFGDNNKWATFPSVSAGWTISNEDFMDNTVNVLDNLKLRAGFGVTGITPSDNYLSQYLYGFAGYGDILSQDGNWIKTLEVTQNVNKDLKWETTKEFNVGLDFSFLKNRISGSFDAYIKKTSDLLYSYSVPVPPNMYSYTLANVGEMKNSGIELLIRGIPVLLEDFQWETTVTISHNKNKLESLSNDLYETDNFIEEGGTGDPVSVPTHCMEVGHALGDFWGLKSVGVDKDGFVLVQVKDSDGNWVNKPFNSNLNEKSNRQRLGNGMPSVYLGWNNTFTYKNFDLSLQFTGQFGYQILNLQRVFYENNSIAYNRLKSADKYYGAINTDGTPYIDPTTGKQKMVKLSSSMGQGFWSDHIEDGDFLKLSNVTLGYNIPLKGDVTNYIKSARVYASASNLFCITGYSGIDPEVSNYFLTPGVDERDKYPTTRSFTVGLSVNF